MGAGLNLDRLYGKADMGEKSVREFMNEQIRFSSNEIPASRVRLKGMPTEILQELKKRNEVKPNYA